MKRSRLVLAAVVSLAVAGSLSTVAVAQPISPAPTHPALTSPAPTSPAPTRRAQAPAQTRLGHSAAALPAGRWAAGSALASQLQQHRAHLARPVRLAHLAPALNRLASVPGAAVSGTADSVSAVRPERDGSVEVTVTGPAAAAAARAVGGHLLASFGGASTVTIAPAKLRSLAGYAGVSQVAPADRPMPQNTTNEGVTASGAQHWADTGNVGNGGSGVKVGIVDLGFKDLQAEIAAGHFNDPDGTPVNVVYPAGQDRCADDTLTAHGTAVSEIVHQMAPRATLYLYCIDDKVGFSAAGSDAVAAGVKIVNSSLAFTAETRGDGFGGNGSPAQTVRAAREAGVLWIQSAGNSARDHWSGSFTDANRDGLSDLQSATSQADEVALDPGTTGDIVLSWDQWPTSSLGVTLAISEWDKSNNQVGQTAYLDQAAGTEPVLQADISNLATDAGYDGGIRYFDVVVLLDHGTPPLHFNLYYGGDVYWSFLSSKDPSRAAYGSVLEPASSPWALAVGAADVHSKALEAFSSRGPTIDGRVKPDLVGFDGVSSNVSEVLTTNPNTNISGFYGTSAAAPNVAGAAALVAGQNPAMDASDLQAFLQRRASPLANPPTNLAGHGLLQLGDPSSGIRGALGSGYVALSAPARIVDTRSGLGGRKGAMVAGTVLAVKLPSSVPATASSVVLNLTGINAKGTTYLSVYADTFSGSTNLGLSTTDPSAAVAAVVRVNGAHGFKLLNRSAATDAVVDVVGYFAAPTATGTLGYAAVSPARLLDTRTTVGGHQAKMAPFEVIKVQVANASGVPADARAAIVNLTALNETKPGYLMAYPSSPGGTSSLDYRTFSRSNLAIVTLAADGSFKLQNRLAYTHAIVDVLGYLSPSATATFVTLPAPVGVVDTRSGKGGRHMAMKPDSILTEDGAGLNEVPHYATALWAGYNALATGSGYLTVYANGSSIPHTSNLDYSAGRNVANAVVANLSEPANGAGGYSTINRVGVANLTEDVFGYFVDAPVPN